MPTPRFKDLEDYGVIGNLETCALVGSDGAVDWLCLPYIESPSVFAGILDPERGGLFRIRPTEKYRAVQRYIGNTNILKTTFYTPLGIASITDFMPVKAIEDRSFIATLLRKVEWVEKGAAELDLEFRPRPNYGRETPFLERMSDGVVARWGPHSLFLHSPIPLHIDNSRAHTTIRMEEGASLWFVLQYNNYRSLSPSDYDDFLHRTEHFWSGWAHECEGEDCVFGGPWHNLVIRSELLLKLLTNSDNGAIAAAVTTSIPEEIGGVRNWDYRYSWIRDAAFTVQALFRLGHREEAMQYRDWLYRILGTYGVSKLKILYPLRGEEDVSETTIDELSGYRDSRPVRIGNAAAGQMQLDIYGEFLNMVYDTTRYGAEVKQEDWPMISEIVEYTCQSWKSKDSGIWEGRGDPKHHVYSKVMCWVAVDRGIRIAREKGFNADIFKWEKTSEEIRETILQKGFSKKLNSFVRSFGSEDLDASSLLIPVTGFLDFDDERVRGTIDAVMKNLLMRDGMVARYNADDGLPGSEGSFVLCSFWLVVALCLCGRTVEAETLFEKILSYLSPLGIISEEVDSNTGKLLGNLPQAFSHIGLINSALHIGIAKGKKDKGPAPIGRGHLNKEKDRGH